MDYVELHFTVTPRKPGTDILIAELAELGFESFVETEDGFLAYIPGKDFAKESINGILVANDISFSFQTNIIKDQNWNKEWENSFTPVNVDNKCIVRAPFHICPKDIAFDLIIEPKMSFGTGHHETTHLMIKAVLTLDLQNKSVLDMGCGTGVLAILASKMGADPVTAIDIDDWSYKNTFENLEKNNINNVNVHQANATILQEQEFLFHTILANINRNILMADIDTYSNSLEKHGHLLLSGFFESDVLALSSRAAESGLELVKESKKNKWTLLHFIKC